MKRASLQRYTPMERGEPMKRSRIKRKPARRVAQRRHMRPWLAFVAKMPCAAELGVYRFDGGQTADPHGYRESMCSGPVQVAHIGVKPGVGLKCPDNETGPLCLRHHTDFDQHRGLFAGWTRDERRAWADGVIEKVRLSAIPTTLEEAWELERLGLGKVIGNGRDGWQWWPGHLTEVDAGVLAGAVSP